MATKSPSPKPDDAQLRLVHPIYLDVPMVISFLAALEGGVSFEDESVRRSAAAAARAREGEGSVRSGIPLFSQLFGFDISGKMSAESHEEASEEVKAVRQHTAASLFNALHDHLHRNGYVREITTAQDLDDLQIGQIVEVTGRFLGNPLQIILDFFGQYLPYQDLEERADQNVTGNPRRSKGGSRQAQPPRLAPEQERALEEARQGQLGVELFKQMRSDLADAPVHDAVVDGPGGLKVILTMSSDFLTPATNQQLRAGNFVVIGKVTRVFEGEEEINLARRTIFGAAPEVVKEIVGSFTESMPLDDAPSPVVPAPALQLLPLAVFI